MKSDVEPLDVVSAIRAVVERQPEAPALDVGSHQVSYRDLWRKAGDIAECLAALYSTKDPRVGLLLGRGQKACEGYLGILRSSATVVPLNPKAPPSRNRIIASLAALEVVLTDAEIPAPEADEWLATGVTVVHIDDVPGAESDRLSSPRMDQDAYVLFTSGSTGTPKGVPVTHGSVAAYVNHAITSFDVRPGCRMSHTFELTFDVSVFDLLVSWAGGATLVVPTEGEVMLAVDYVNTRRLTHFFSVPSAISRARSLRTLTPNAMPELKSSAFIGEPLDYSQASAWKTAAPRSALRNSYGPTELTVACAEYRLPDDPADWPETSNGTVPIGAVYAHLEHLLVDNERQQFSEGELCVRGAQRLRSYDDPAANTGHFLRIVETTHGAVAVPIEDGEQVTPDHWYSTGDRVRLEGGVLVHLGRRDRQVKLRGYRVELGEVEAAMRALDGIEDAAAVVFVGRADREIAAFFSGHLEDTRALRARLMQTLPSYMVPTKTQWLEYLPLNANGKVDYAQLNVLLATLGDS